MVVDGDIGVGFEFLPQEIIDHLKRSVTPRPTIPHVYDVTGILACLRKLYFKRMFPELNSFNIASLYHISRGGYVDRMFTALFDINQKTFVLTRDGITLTGTLDFVCVDENGERAIYDLKAPKSTYFKQLSGAGRQYRRQVRAYMAMAHECGELLDINKAYVLMCAESVVREEVSFEPRLLPWRWERVFLLDSALEKGDPSLLTGPEEDWECHEDFCVFRKQCGKDV